MSSVINFSAFVCLLRHQQIVIHLEIHMYRFSSRISKQFKNLNKIQQIILPLMKTATALAARTPEKKIVKEIIDRQDVFLTENMKE